MVAKDIWHVNQINIQPTDLYYSISRYLDELCDSEQQILASQHTEHIFGGDLAHPGQPVVGLASTVLYCLCL
jgi:hypothetical protein